MMEYLTNFFRELSVDAAAKGVGAATGTTLLTWVGGSWVAAKALLVLLCIDFILGFYRAWKDECVSLNKLRQGGAKFFFYLLSIVTAHHVDQALNEKFAPLVQMHLDLTGFLILYLVICDALSAFRHLHCLGVPIPRQIINRLESLRDCKLPGVPSKDKGKKD